MGKDVDRIPSSGIIRIRDLMYSLPDPYRGFLEIGPRLAALAANHIRATSTPEPSVSWAVTRYLIERARIGCVPGVDFGPSGEGYIRFCFARDRHELTGALDTMTRLFETRA